MTQSNHARLSVFSISSLLSYFFATFFSAKELAKLPFLFPKEDKSKESVELAINIATPLLEPRLNFSTPLFGSAAISLLQISLFVVLLFIFYGRFYSHAEALEKRYQGENASIEPRGQNFLRFVWVFIALNIPNLVSTFNSAEDAMLLVRWILASLLLMYVSIGIWHYLCSDQWINATSHSRLKDANFKILLSIFDALPVFVIAIALALTFRFNTPAVGFLAIVASLGTCFVSVIFLIWFYLSGIYRAGFSIFMAWCAVGGFFLSSSGSQLMLWLLSLL